MYLLDGMIGVINNWLTSETPVSGLPPCDFGRICHEVRSCDVLLVEGRTRVSEVIKMVTQSSWSHAALYIGRLHDIDDEQLRAKLEAVSDFDANTPLLIEAELGQGVIVSPLSKYKKDHVRICRPRGLTQSDAQQVVGYAIGQLGKGYHVRQMLDLARLLFPWGIMPRRWRSTVFEHNAGDPTKTVCSTMIAEAFASIDFPVTPFVVRDGEKRIRFYKRNPSLAVPQDFDYSPYFDIIKYPLIGIVGLEGSALYRQLPWAREVAYYSELGDLKEDQGKADAAHSERDSALEKSLKELGPTKFVQRLP